jgi:hypothetical protein
MSCGWDVKWLAFTKEKDGANYQSKHLGIDKQMILFRVKFNALSYNTTRRHTNHIMDHSEAKYRLDDVWIGCKVGSIHQRNTWC